MNYKIIKLNNGDEIIAGVEENDNSITVEKPMLFITSTMTDPVGRTVDVTYLKDWLNHSDNKTIQIEKTRVVAITDASKKSIEFYDLEKKKSELTEESVVDGTKFNVDDFMDDMSRIVDDFMNNMIQDENELKEQQENFPFSDSNEYEKMEDEIYKKKKKRKKKKKDLPANLIPDELNNRPMIYLNMVIPPEAIMNLISSGVLDPDVLQAMIDQVKKRNKFTGDEKSRQDFGNKFSDWNPDPSSDDYK
jgi:hypothetical protein